MYVFQTNKLASYLRLAAVRTSRGNKRNKVYAKHRIKMNVATWNVRTLLDRDESSNAERRTIVARELASYNVDIAALSETRLSGEISFQKRVLDTRFSGRARLKERKEKR